MRKSSIIKKRIAVFLSVIFIIFVAVIAFYYYFPISKNISSGEPLVKNNDTDIEYEGKSYIKMNITLEAYYNKFKDKMTDNQKSCTEKMNLCLLKRKIKGSEKEVFRYKYATLSDINSTGHYYLTNDGFIVYSVGAEGFMDDAFEAIYIDSSIEPMPELSPDSIDCIEIYHGSYFDKYKEYYDDAEAFIENIKPDKSEMSFLSREIEPTFISNFVGEFNAKGNLVNLYEDISSKYQMKDIVFVLKFKDESFPFEVLFTKYAIFGSEYVSM